MKLKDLLALNLFLYSLILVSCGEENTKYTESQALAGVWKPVKPLSQTYLDSSWIPQNLNIGAAASKNKLRVRILDPIACTDSYPDIVNSNISFEQYGLLIRVVFINESSAVMSAAKNGRIISFPIIKSSDKPYFGPCD